MKSKSTLQEFLDDNAALRAKLEAARPGCTADVEVVAGRKGRTPTLDELFCEQSDLVRVSLATPAPGPAAATIAPAPTATQPTPAKPDFTLLTLTEKSRLVNSLDKEILAARHNPQLVAELTGKKSAILATLNKPTAKTTAPEPKAAKLTTTQRCLQAKGLPADTEVALTPIGDSDDAGDGEIFD